MGQPRWEHYSLVAHAPIARSWLTIQANLGLATTTVDAHGRALQDYLAFCQRRTTVAEQATREQIALYVNDLTSRPSPRTVSLDDVAASRGLANATLQQRLAQLPQFSSGRSFS
jgi:integrase/recombinase XerD